MALTTNTQSISQGVINQSAGRVITDGGAAAITTFTVGFLPRMVRWVNVTDLTTYEWYEGMAAASAVKTVAAGTRTLNLTEGPTIVNGSFSVPVTAILASKTYAWECYG